MINIQRFICNMFQENCYVASDESKECVVIDCGAYYNEERQAIVKYIDSERLKVTHLLVTHGHIDHNFGNDTIFNHYGVMPEVAAADARLMRKLKEQAMSFCGITLKTEIPPAELLPGEDGIISFGHHRLKVIAAPGHSPGSVIFYDEAEKIAFSGDTLFRFSVGRTDLWGGSYDDLRSSLRKLCSLLPPETIVMTGHGPRTRMSDEMKGNPYIRQ